MRTEQCGKGHNGRIVGDENPIVFRCPSKQIWILVSANLGVECCNDVKIRRARNQTASNVLIEILVGQKTKHRGSKSGGCVKIAILQAAFSQSLPLIGVAWNFSQFVKYALRVRFLLSKITINDLAVFQIIGDDRVNVGEINRRES